MAFHSPREDLASRLKGQRLVIPDMRPIFTHWPNGQNENYKAVRKALVDQAAVKPLDEGTHKLVFEANAALLAATWWPTSALRQYKVMTDLVIWFGVWDDAIEQLGSDTDAAERLRAETKGLVRRALCFDQEERAGDAHLLKGGADGALSHSSPLVKRFEGIAKEMRAFLDEDRLKILLDHFDQYIDATRLEAAEEESTEIPSLDQYWAVRTLASGMGILLGFSEYALQVKVPLDLINSDTYKTLWLNTIVINSIVNDLISFKKEMKAGSVLSSVAILYHELGDDLDAAVRSSLNHLRELVGAFDAAAAALLADVRARGAGQPDDDNSNEGHRKAIEAVEAVIELLRMINTGNLEWSLQAQRYGVGQFMTESGEIDLIL